MSFKPADLRYFVAVAEEGQITRAATRMFISQPSLSQAIVRLEAALGFDLMERHSRGITLTGQGSLFLEKARAVIASEEALGHTADALARAATGAIAVGFVGPPPTMTDEGLWSSFARANPGAEVIFRDLPFPRGSTERWLDEVDVAVCHRPLAEDGVVMLPLRDEPRVAVMRSDHPLAALSDLPLDALLEETFISYDDAVQPEWAAFHSLDDCRGAPPLSLTTDRASNSLQMLSAFSATPAVTTVPACDAEVALRVLPGAVGRPVPDADPARISLVWNAHNLNPLLVSLREVVEGLDHRA